MGEILNSERTPMSVFQSVAEQRKDDWVKPHSPLNIDELSALLLLREQLEIIELIEIQRLRAKQQEFGDP